MKLKVLFILICFTLFNNAKSQVILNEYCCSNLSSIADNFGEYEDWIELYNTNFNSVNLAGYYLSDNVNDPLKWKIPSGVVIAGNGYLTIWASGRGVFTGGVLHASFKLTQSKKNPDWIILSNASGALIEKVQIQRHQKGHSMGKIGGGWQIFTTPSQGQANSGISKTAYAAAPVFVKAPGFYNASFRLYLTTTEPNSRIYYSTDGSNPLVGGLQYNSSGIFIDSTKVIKAITYSYNTGVLSSFISFGTYFINVSHTMPIVSIAGTDLNTLANGNNALKPEGSFEFFDKYKVLKETAYGNFNSHGQDSWANDQRSLDYKTRDEMGYADAIHEKLFSLSERKDFQGIILRAAGDDNYPAAHHSSNAGSAHIRDAYVQNMAIQGGLDVDARTGEKAIVYLNGKYWGVYDMRERADEQDYTKFYYNQDKYNLQYIETWGSTWAQYGGSQAITDWGTLRTFIMNNNMANPSNYKLVTDQLDVKSLVDYAIVNSVSVCSDWLNYNTGWWRGLDPKGGHKKWGYTLWDNDAVFGFYINYTGVPSTAYTALPCNIESNSLDDPEGHIDIIKKLRENAEFNQFYISRYIDLFNTTFSCSNMLYNLDSIINLLTPEMTKHADRWFGTFSEWSTNKNTLRNYVSNRCAYLSTGLNTCYNLNGPYNTTFKTIPANSGSIQVNSLVFSNLPYTGRYHGKIDVLLKAIPEKNYVFDYWTAGIDTFKTATALANAVLRIAGSDTIVAHFAPRTNLPKLNFTEINYNPEATWNSGTWFELTNFGNSAIDISGWKIAQGKWREYTLPNGSVMAAGAHWIFASDSARFNTIYKNPALEKRYLPFDLSTIGEALLLIDSQGVQFLNVKYDNSQPWPIAADGVGRTMELKSDTMNCSLVSNWRNGCVGGSPGAAFQNCNEPIIITEINYNSGQLIDAGTWFEVLNTTNQNINLSGYSFRNKDFEFKYVIPASTVLNANSRMVFCNDLLKFEKYFPTQNVIALPGFGLANSGDEIKLYNTRDTLVFSVVYDDTLSFTKQPNGSGYTLDYNFATNDYSQGTNWNIACLGGSPNGTKGNCIPNMLFTEINYKSALFNDAGDWFEIKNTGNNALNMKGWQFTDSTSAGFFITQDIFINKNSYMVLVADTVKFKKMYPGVTNYIGNLNFNLSSSGERIKIFDSLNNYISLVNYNDSLPWPSFIDGRGYSMELRYDTSDYHLGGRWKRSCLGGSPGAPNPNACNDSVIIAEFNCSSHPKADACDWIEIWNKGNTPQNISQWLFQDNDTKDTFLIPSNTVLNVGERLVLVNDSNKFKTIFPDVKNVIGNFAFGLSSVSDYLILRDPASKLKFGMSYTMDSTWDPLALAQGYTLELVKDSLDRSISSYWKSKCPGGSPGVAAGNCKEELAITEINYKSDNVYNTGDWFEIYNKGTIPVNFTSHYLSNVDSTIITNTGSFNTLLFANEYLVLSNDTSLFKKNFPLVNNVIKVTFSLRDTGDIIKLFDANKTLMLSNKYSASKTWPEMSNGKGMTLERVNYSATSGTSADWVDGCFGGSPGMAKQICNKNIVISEINYNPMSTEDDGQWIELKNTGSDSVSLLGYFIQNNAFNNRIYLNSPRKLAPQEHFVIVADSVKFNQFHQLGNGLVQYYQGVLCSKSADAFGVYDGNEKKIYHAAFDAVQPLLTLTNGRGHTLELIDTGTVFYSVDSWFAGCRHGSAGTDYKSCTSPVLVSEINYKSHPKFDMGHWIEIKNTSKYALDMSGWILLNNGGSQRIKNNILLPSGGYLLVGDKLQSLKNNYTLNATATDSLRITMNGSDAIYVLTADSVLQYQTNYSNALNWPSADGNAYTLEYSDTALLKYIQGCPGGSPGSAYMPCSVAMEITEINYDSHQKNKSNDWIEIRSTSKIPFAPDHWQLTVNGNGSKNNTDKYNLLFQNERLVMCSYLLDFSSIHNIANVMENSGLQLPDTAGIIRVMNNASQLIDSVNYRNVLPWPSDAAGTGRTLELMSGSDNSIPQNWFAGCIGGSPGKAYSSPCPYPLIVSEVNYHSLPNYNAGDWIELHNTTNSSMNIGKFSVKTKSATMTTPSGTSIVAGGYLVLVKSKATFNAIFPAVQNTVEVASLDIADGDKIELFDSSGNISYYMAFDTLAPWPLNTNKGYTLEFRDTATNPWSAGSWFRSCFAGTPGRRYSLPCDINGIGNTSALSWLQIYPNPNTGSFTISSPYKADMILYDLHGKAIWQQTIQEGNNKLELNLAKGLYLISVIHDGKVEQRKIIIADSK